MEKKRLSEEEKRIFEKEIQKRSKATQKVHGKSRRNSSVEKWMNHRQVKFPWYSGTPF